LIIARGRSFPWARYFEKAASENPAEPRSAAAGSSRRARRRTPRRRTRPGRGPSPSRPPATRTRRPIARPARSPGGGSAVGCAPTARRSSTSATAVLAQHLAVVRRVNDDRVLRQPLLVHAAQPPDLLVEPGDHPVVRRPRPPDLVLGERPGHVVPLTQRSAELLPHTLDQRPEGGGSSVELHAEAGNPLRIGDLVDGGDPAVVAEGESEDHPRHTAGGPHQTRRAVDERRPQAARPRRTGPARASAPRSSGATAIATAAVFAIRTASGSGRPSSAWKSPRQCGSQEGVHQLLLAGCGGLLGRRQPVQHDQ
jgi:hypothetical protein